MNLTMTTLAVTFALTDLKHRANTSQVQMKAAAIT
jgi:hypothetical protein